MKRLLLTALALTALASIVSAQVTLTDIGAATPTPGANDISQLLNTAQSSNNDGLNYYFDNSSPPGGTFTTGNSTYGYTMTGLALKTAGNGGNTELVTQPFRLIIYSVSGTGGTNGTFVAGFTNTAAFTAQNDWFQWTNLNVILSPNTVFAYSFGRLTQGYEQMANQVTNPYAGGQICLCTLPSGGHSLIKYGTTGVADATFDVNLTPIQVAAGTPFYLPSVSPIYAGSTVTLYEPGAGSTPLYYQWLTDNGTGGPITNMVGSLTINSNLTVNTTGFTTNYNYACIVSNATGTATSSMLTLIITNASSPIIVTNTASPNTTTNFVGLSETYAASVTGTLPITYQWQVSPNPDGSGAANISGATNATLTLTNLQTTNTGYYSLLATNLVSPFITNSAWTQLTVLPITNEFITWSNPVSILGLTASQILTNPPGALLDCAYFGPAAGPIPVTVNGNTYIFYGDGSTASVAGNQGSTTVGWTSLGDTTGDTNLDTVLNQMSFDGGTHTITIKNLVPGQQYAVQLFALDTRAIGTGRANNFQDPNNAADVSQTFDMGDADYIIGTFTADSTTTAVIRQNLLVGGAGNINALVVRALSYTPIVPPSFSKSPSSVTAYAGRTVQFSGTATGIPVPTYQWQDNAGNNLINGGQFSGVTSNTLTISNLNLGNSGSQYVLVATNSAAGTPSSAVTLNVIAAPLLSGIYSTNVLALHPVAYWPLNDNGDAPYNGGAPLYDASGNQYDGVYQVNAENGALGIVGPQSGDGYLQFADGQGALELPADTVNSWANTPALNLNTNTVTISMWINPNNSAQSNSTGLFVNRNAGTVAGMTYDGVSGSKLAYVWNNNDPLTYNYTNGPVIPSNIWSFVALVITPTNASFYVINTNGVATTTFTNNHNNMTWNGTTANIYLGADSSATRVFNGIVDETAVFNYALSSNQLYSLTLTNIITAVNTNAATLNFAATVSGGAGSQTLNFSWATDHLGWQLYTNAVGLTSTGSWFPVPGSANVTSESIGINPAKTNVFFQMRYP